MKKSKVSAEQLRYEKLVGKMGSEFVHYNASGNPRKSGIVTIARIISVEKNGNVKVILASPLGGTLKRASTVEARSLSPLSPQEKQNAQRWILVINGPNLNMLGLRDPAKYGSKKLSDVIASLKKRAAPLGIRISEFQSNHEGELIDFIQEHQLSASGIIINAGGLTHTSVSLRDALDVARSMGTPAIEVHLSAIHKREEFRHVSLLQSVCIDQISGFKDKSYSVALSLLIGYLRENREELLRKFEAWRRI